jgi:hypothetical protein
MRQMLHWQLMKSWTWTTKIGFQSMDMC